MFPMTISQGTIENCECSEDIGNPKVYKRDFFSNYCTFLFMGVVIEAREKKQREEGGVK